MSINVTIIGSKDTDSWTCTCGNVNQGKFCIKCGSHRPAAPKPPELPKWICAKCGSENDGNFCTGCAEPKPGIGARWVCEDCGKVNFAKFCIGCGAKKQDVAVIFSADSVEPI